MKIVMAKTEKAPEPETDGEEAAEGAAPEPKKGLGKILGLLKNKKVLMIGAPVLLLLLGGIGAGTYFFVIKPHAEKKPVAQEAQLTPPLVTFDDVDDLLVNIQSPDATPMYLKLSVTLELDNDLEKTGVTALMPRIKDEFQAYLRELRADDLKGSAGVLRMKEELMRRVNVAAAPYKVRDVLLKNMIVQ
jgi:flagellar protein FliL